MHRIRNRKCDRMKKVLESFFYLFFPLIIGGMVGFFISGSIQYDSLIKPPLAPPAKLFPIAWSIIYLLMGISYFLLMRKKDYIPLEKMIYYLQLFVNAMWSIIFFLWKWRAFSILWILLLDFLVIKMVMLFYNSKKISAYLNIPYLIWIVFATYLTIGITILN